MMNAFTYLSTREFLDKTQTFKCILKVLKKDLITVFQKKGI